MNRIAVLDGLDTYDLGDLGAIRRGGKKRRRRKGFSVKQKRQHAKFRKAAKSCSRRRKGSYKVCMKKKLKKGRR